MTIHSRESGVDARVTSGLLARSVLAYLGNADVTQDADAVGNLFRLLEMYRHRAFSSPSYHGVLERQPLGAVRSIAASKSQALSMVEAALERAHNSAFDAQPREEVVDVLERTLRAYADKQQLDRENLERTKVFLTTFLEALR